MRCSPPGSRLSTEASGTWCRCKPSFSPSSTLQPTQSTVHSVHIKLLQLTQVNKLTAHYCTSLCTLLYNYVAHSINYYTLSVSDAHKCTTCTIHTSYKNTPFVQQYTVCPTPLHYVHVATLLQLHPSVAAAALGSCADTMVFRIQQFPRYHPPPTAFSKH